jgi:hypothetical protein
MIESTWLSTGTLALETRDVKRSPVPGNTEVRYWVRVDTAGFLLFYISPFVINAVKPRAII